MSGRGKVFISHATEDNARCAGVVQCLSAWGVDTWFETQPPDAGQQLSQQTQMALAESSIFLRICTAATAQSYWTSFEMGTFLSLQAEEYRRGDNTRAVVSLILDAAYTRQPFDYAATLIDATAKPQAQWLNELRAALGLAPLTDAEAAALPLNIAANASASVSRRRFVVAGVAGAATLAVAGSAGLLLHSHPWTATTSIPPMTSTSPNGPQPKMADPNLKWWFKTKYNYLSSPVIADGLVLTWSSDLTTTKTGSMYYALNSQGLTKLWAAPENTATVGPLRSTSIANGVIYTRFDINLLAINEQTGDQIWQQQYAATGGIPVATNGVIFAPNLDTLTAYNTNGKAVWYGTLKGYGWVYSVVAGIAYVTTYDKHDNGVTDYYVLAFDTSGADKNFDLTSGAKPPNVQPLWSYQTPRQVDTVPAAANGIVVFGCEDTYIYALDATTGTLKWKQKTGNTVTSQATIDGNTVYVSSNDGNVYALDLTTGTVLWTYSTGTDAKGVGANSSAVVVDGKLYFGSHTKAVIALDPATGKLLKQYKTDGGNGIPAIADGILYTADDAYYVYAFAL